MSSLDIFKAHHAKIRSLIGELQGCLHADRVADGSGMLSDKFKLLFKVILLHLDTEDTLLYPEMFGCNNDKIRLLAKEYQVEMGWIADSFKSFVNYWAKNENMAAAPDKFCREAHRILHSLRERIDKEEQHLYPQFEL